MFLRRNCRCKLAYDCFAYKQSIHCGNIAFWTAEIRCVLWQSGGALAHAALLRTKRSKALFERLRGGKIAVSSGKRLTGIRAPPMIPAYRERDPEGKLQGAVCPFCY